MSLDLVGETSVKVFVPDNGKPVDAVVYVFNGRETTLLSKCTSELLDVLRVGPLVGKVDSGLSGPSDSGLSDTVGFGVRP